MQAYIRIAGGAATGAGSAAAVRRRGSQLRTAYFVIAGNTLNVSDPTKGVLGE